MHTDIVKVEIGLNKHCALVANIATREGGTRISYPAPYPLRARMGGKKRGYFRAAIEGERVELLEPVADLGW